MDDSSLFLLIAEHWFTWNEIYYLKTFILVAKLNKKNNVQKANPTID